MFPHDGSPPESVLAALGDERFEVRCQALEALEESIPYLKPTLSQILPLVEDPAWQVRGAATRILSSLWRGEPEVGRALLARALHDPHVWVRHAALAGLELLMLPAGTLDAPLLEALASDSPTLVRSRVLKVLCRLRPSSEPLLQALVGAVTDAGGEVRAEALRALGESRRARQEVLRAITGALGDAEPLVRETACEALARLSPLGDAEVEALGRLASDPEVAVRVACARALGQLPSRAHREALRTLLRDADARVREAVVLAVGSGGGLAPPPPWREFLEDPSALVRQAAERFLEDAACVEQAGVGTSASLESLASTLLGQHDVDVRDALASRMAEDEPTGLPLLLEGLRHPRVRIRHRAARALGFFLLHGDVTARQVALLGEALRDPSERVRCAATEALGRVGGPALSTYPELLRRAFERSPSVPTRAQGVVRALRSALPASGVFLGKPWETAEQLFLRWAEDPLPRAHLSEQGLIELCLARERWHRQFCRTPPPPRSKHPPTSVPKAAERAAQAAVAHGASRRRRERPEKAARDREREFVWLLGRLQALAWAEPATPPEP